MQPKQIKANLREAGMIKGGHPEFRSVLHDDQPLAITHDGQRQMQVQSAPKGVSALSLFETPHSFGGQRKALPQSQKLAA